MRWAARRTGPIARAECLQCHGLPVPGRVPGHRRSDRAARGSRAARSRRPVRPERQADPIRCFIGGPPRAASGMWGVPLTTRLESTGALIVGRRDLGSGGRTAMGPVPAAPGAEDRRLLTRARSPARGWPGGPPGPAAFGCSVPAGNRWNRPSADAPAAPCRFRHGAFMACARPHASWPSGAHRSGDVSRSTGRGAGWSRRRRPRPGEAARRRRRCRRRSCCRRRCRPVRPAQAAGSAHSRRV